MIGKLIKSAKKRINELNRLICGGKKLLVLSDSHGGVFEYIYDNRLLLPHIVNVEIVGGATAYGLLNANSTTKAFDKFVAALHRFNKYDIVIIQLGEVDCSFILWEKARQKNEDVLLQLRYSLDGYRKLLDVLLKLKKKVIISGVVLPTLKDGQVAPAGVELRNRVAATQRAKTELVLSFNKELKEIARLYGFTYFDITEETIDWQNGVIKDEFVRNDIVDHHQNQEKTAVLWAAKIKELLA